MGVGWRRLELVVVCCVVCGENIPTVMFLPYRSHRSHRSHQSTIPVPLLQPFPPFPRNGYVPNLPDIFTVHTDDDDDDDTNTFIFIYISLSLHSFVTLVQEFHLSGGYFLGFIQKNSLHMYACGLYQTFSNFSQIARNGGSPQNSMKSNSLGHWLAHYLE
jgi:hypothetical protein